MTGAIQGDVRLDVQDNHGVDQPYLPEEGYHLSKGLADKAMGFIGDSKQSAVSKPWSTWFCPGANHAPHHVPQEWADKYKGQFDDGSHAGHLQPLSDAGRWRSPRRLGCSSATPTRAGCRWSFTGPRGSRAAEASASSIVRPWDSLSADKTRLFSRMAVVYAGFSEYTDQAASDCAWAATAATTPPWLSSSSSPPRWRGTRDDTAQVAHHRIGSRITGLVVAIREGDEATIEAAVLRLSRRRRWLAPLALTVSALVLLLDGLRLVFSNWRLTLIQALPAMWIWLAMLDLKIHVLHGRTLHVIRGPLALVAVCLIVVVTAACFYLNALVAFAITSPEGPAIRPAMRRARGHLGPILGSGVLVGIALGFSTVIATRYGHPWFGLTLSVVIGVMMVCYLAVPARIIGVKRTQSRRDKLVAGVVSGALGAAVCTPPYLLGRIGLLMLGSHVLFIPGVVLVALGFTLQAGATGAVKAIKMSATLLAGSKPTVA